MTRIHNRYWFAGSVAVLTALVYLPALRNGFVELDDAVYVVDNPYIRSLDISFFHWAFFKFYAANWHPLAWISHALDYALWGMNPSGHHLTNIILHAFNTFLVVLLAIRLLEIHSARSARSGNAEISLGRRSTLVAASATGLLFGLHPVHVESAAWVAERKDLLCALFFLLSIMQYESYLRDTGEKNDVRRTSFWFADRRYLAALGFFVLALLSKPMAVTLPVVLVLLDWFPHDRLKDLYSIRVVLGEKIPFFILSFASSVLTVLAQRAGEALVPLQLVPWPERMLAAAKALIAYLGKMVIPRDLVPYYPYPGLREISLSRGEYLIPLLLVIGATATCIAVAKRRKLWLAIWFSYVIMLLPVLGLVQVGGQAMADRYTYLPSFGPFLLAGIGAARLYGGVSAATGDSRLVRGAGVTAAVVGILFLSGLTIKQIGIWKNSMSVFDAILAEDARRSPMVYFHRGVAYEKEGKPELAIADYTKAIALFPSYYDAFFSRGTVYELIGRPDLAAEDYSTAISLKPSSYEAYTNRGLAYKKMGRRSDAVADFERAVTINASAGKAYFNLGSMLAEDGLFVQAIDQFSRAIAAEPMDAEAYANRGIAYAVTSQQGPAMKDFNRAIELRPDVPDIYYNRGKLYAASGFRERAAADFQKACQLGDELSCRILRE
jgi:Tfp pilus assembly protein PilF